MIASWSALVAADPSPDLSPPVHVTWGVVRVGGYDVRDLTLHRRSTILLTQDAPMFHDTILEPSLRATGRRRPGDLRTLEPRRSRASYERWPYGSTPSSATLPLSGASSSAWPSAGSAQGPGDRVPTRPPRPFAPSPARVPGRARKARRPPPCDRARLSTVPQTPTRPGSRRPIAGAAPTPSSSPTTHLRQPVRPPSSRRQSLRVHPARRSTSHRRTLSSLATARSWEPRPHVVVSAGASRTSTAA